MFSDILRNIMEILRHYLPFFVDAIQRSASSIEEIHLSSWIPRQLNSSSNQRNFPKLSMLTDIIWKRPIIKQYFSTVCCKRCTVGHKIETMMTSLSHAFFICSVEMWSSIEVYYVFRNAIWLSITNLCCNCGRKLYSQRTTKCHF